VPHTPTDSGVWRRFRAATDGFTFTREGDIFVAHVVTNAERVLETFLVLSGHLPPVIDVALEDVRTNRLWLGEDVSLIDARETVVALKTAIAQFGGVEIAFYDREDQLTLSPHLELFSYARTDRWHYLLQGNGLEEQKAVRSRRWKQSRSGFQPSPPLSLAVAAAAERLGLRARGS
jgi:hypothetical protein